MLTTFLTTLGHVTDLCITVWAEPGLSSQQSMLPGLKFTGGHDKRPYLSLLLRLFLETIAIRIQISVFANNWKLKLRPEVSHHLAKATQVHSPLVFRQCSND